MAVGARILHLVGPQRGFMPYVAMVIAQLCYAGMALFSKAAIGKGMSPYVFVFYREALATLFLAPFTLCFERKKDLPSPPLLRIFLTAFCGGDSCPIAMVIAQLCYAGMALFSKAALGKGMSPYVFVFYREALATLFLAPFTLCFERKKDLPSPPLLRIFLTALCGDTISTFLFSISLKYTSATFASASTNAIPAITLILALLLRVEKLSRKQIVYGSAKILGSIICVTGAFMYTFYKGPPVGFINQHQATGTATSQTSLTASVSQADWLKGCSIMLLAHTSWSLWLILQGPLVRRYPAELRLTVLQCACSSFQTAIIAVAFNRRPSSWKLEANIRLFSVLFCGASTGITFWLVTWCVQKKGPVFTAVFTPLALIATAVYSAVFWKEIVHWGSVGAAILLVLGLYCVLWGKNKEEEATKQQRVQDAAPEIT